MKKMIMSAFVYALAFSSFNAKAMVEVHSKTK
jgi:hypothetical protein